MSGSNYEQSGVVFFDGICGICNTFVDFLLVLDRNNNLLFAPLQGVTAQKKLSDDDLKNISTIVFQTERNTYYQSDAVIQILVRVGGIWKLFGIFKIVPKIIRDSFYQYIAKNRYKWFRQRETCRMPTQEEKNKILL